MKNEKTFLEKQREEQIKTEKAAKQVLIGAAMGLLFLRLVIFPILTVYAIGVFAPSVTLTWYTYLAAMWLHFALKGDIKIGR